jgi:hypothetical protein
VGKAHGWYRDPFGIHEDRYFTEGFPTKLVRDLGVESYDLPPDEPVTEAELIPVSAAADDDGGAEQERRSRHEADIARGNITHTGRAVFDYYEAHRPIEPDDS